MPKAATSPKSPAAAVPAEKPKLTKEQSLVAGNIFARARGAKAYKQADGYLVELIALVGVGNEVALPAGRKFRVTDAFAGVRHAKKFVLIDRYSLEEVK